VKAWRSGRAAQERVGALALQGKLAVTRFKDLVAWQKAMEWAKRVYELTARFPCVGLPAKGERQLILWEKLDHCAGREAEQVHRLLADPSRPLPALRRGLSGGVG